MHNQVIQNKVLRILTGSRVEDKVSINHLVERTNMLSLNQMKIKEIWKALNVKDYPLVLEKHSLSEDLRITKSNYQ